MQRRAFLAASAALVTPASGHWISSKQRGESCTVASPCGMCRHNHAHKQGHDHDENGNWYNRTTGAQAIRTELANPGQAPTPEYIVEWVVKRLNLTASDTFLDPGCGDGRWLIAAAKSGCSCIGIEIDPKMAETARANVRKAGITNVVVITGDATKEPWVGGASVIACYLYTDILAEVYKRCTNARVIASVMHQLPTDGSQTRHRIGDWQVFIETR